MDISNVTLNAVSVKPVKVVQTNSQINSSSPEKVQPIQPIESDFDIIHEPEIITYNKDGSINHDHTKKEYESEYGETDVEKKDSETIHEQVEREKKELAEKESFERIMFPPFSFDYNHESQDFYIKVERGNFIKEVIQYPTEAMMEWKIYRKQLLDTYV